MIFDHILVTTDFSEDARTAYDMACFQAKVNNSRISLLSVFDEFEIPSILEKQLKESGKLDELKESYYSECRSRLEEVAKKDFHRMEVTPVAIFSAQPAHEEILKYMQEEGVHLVVISTHGRGAVSNFFMGSTCQKVIRGATCPLLVIPKIDIETNDRA